MNRYVVPYSFRGSLIGNEEIDALAALLRGDQTLSCGEQREAFETEFARYLGVAHALTVTSGTVALELATYLIGFQPGDVLIASPQTFQASINPLLDMEVEVRFCDVDPNSLCIDPHLIEQLVCPRTRAIYLTHYGGLMADMDAILSIAAKHGVLVVEDCAHAHGSEYRGKRPGAMGDIGCYSFQTMKNMSTLGEGGLITFNNDRWFNTVVDLRACEPDADFVERRGGRIGPYAQPRTELLRHQKNAYTHDCITMRRRGTNATMSEPAALVGRIQLSRLPEFVARRRAIAARLNREFEQIDGLRVQREPEGSVHSYHLYTFFVEPRSGIDHDKLLAEIDAAGVEVQLRYFPIHLLPEWRMRGGRVGQCPVAEQIWFEQQVNLPIYPSLTNQQVDFMVDAVKAAALRARR